LFKYGSEHKGGKWEPSVKVMTRGRRYEDTRSQATTGGVKRWMSEEKIDRKGDGELRRDDK
jgi:hypothetical protein